MQTFFLYNDNGRLKNVAIIDSDGTDPTVNESYMYNNNGQRLIKQFDDGTSNIATRYLYSGTSVLMTADNAGVKVTENVLSQSGLPLSQICFAICFRAKYFLRKPLRI